MYTTDKGKLAERHGRKTTGPKALLLSHGCQLPKGCFFVSLGQKPYHIQQNNIRDILETLSFTRSYTSLKDLITRDVLSLTEMLKSHDFPVYQHSLNVSVYAAKLANKIGLAEEEVTRITIAALLHDIGKTKIPSSILNKPGRLSNEEWELIKEHPREGVAFLAKYPWSYDMISMIGHHHEKVDGSGYYGLSGGDICLGAKIICVADAFDAMVSSRPYSEPMAVEVCCHELELNCGSQFEASLVECFVSMANASS